MTALRQDYATLRWLLIPAIGAHHFEEWLTFPRTRHDAEPVLARLGIGLQSPAWDVTQLALVLVTIVPALVVVYAALGRQNRGKDFLLCALAGIFFANAVLIHIPAAIAAASYAPGVVTATLVLLPLCLALWRSAVARRLLTWPQVIGAAVLGALMLLPSIVAAMLLADRLVQLRLVA